jgi:hypothetical protein
MAADGSDVYICYGADVETSTDTYVQFRKSSNYGGSWSTPYTIAADTDESPCMAVDGDTIWINYDNNDIRKSKSLDGGDSWDYLYEIIPLGGNPASAISMDATPGDIYCAFNWYNFGDKLVVNGSTVENGAVEDTAIAVIEDPSDGDDIYISYYKSTDLRFAASTTGRMGPWSSVYVDSTNDVGDYSSLSIDGNEIYISYYDATSGNLKFAKSTDSGSSWPIIRTVDSIGDVGKNTSIAVQGDKVYIIYYDANNKAVKFAKSVDGGNSWD